MQGSMTTNGKTSRLFRIFSRPRFICLIGIDGSGKTTQSRRLVEESIAVPYPPKYMWCRYSRRLSGYAVRFARTHSRTAGEDSYVQDKRMKSALFRRKWIAVLWAYASLVEYWCQILFSIVPRRLAGYSITCDRYTDDALADLVANIGCDRNDISSLLDNPILRLYPKPDATIYLRISPETSVSRKDDPNVPSIEYLRERASIYDVLADIQRHIVVDAEQPSEQVFQEIISLLEERIDSTGGDC